MVKVFSAILCAALLLSGCTAAVDVAAPRQAMGAAPVSSVTQEQAQEIALEHAALPAEQVDRLHTEYDIDDGRPRYEVQFDYDGWEYDYEIDAATGEIISYDRDKND